MRLSWKAAQGATQYLVLCSAAPDGAEDYTTEVEFIRTTTISCFLCLGCSVLALTSVNWYHVSLLLPATSFMEGLFFMVYLKGVYNVRVSHGK